MRRAVALAIVLAVALSGVAMAKGHPTMVTGTYTYLVDGNPGLWRTISLNARDPDAVAGTWAWTTPLRSAMGSVTCFRVNGADAWLAGPITGGDIAAPAVFLWLHDGGAPGFAGDLALTWTADPGETLADMEALCEEMAGSSSGFVQFPVGSGNLTIHGAK